MATVQVSKRELKNLLQDEAMKLPDLNIVVSGLAGRYPKSDSVNEFEEHLYEGVDMINDQDDSRFNCGLFGLPPRAGRLKDLSSFDCEFFGYTPEEANYIDYQMRILYEVVYESIIDAGVNPASLRGTNTGVFFGLHCNEFENAMADDPAFKSNGYYVQFATKIAQYFDLRGLTITFDAACASGFVGLHNAVQAINDGLIDQAIVCSSNIPVHPTGSFIFLQMQMLSPTGYSRFLDSRADGYVKSEACVSMLVQRKHLALRNYASFMATMSSVDGFKAEGITFPSAKSQEQLIRQTKILAGISTNHVEYLEAHGTGTPAGDPQEASALSSVYFPAPAKWADGADEQVDEVDERVIGPLFVGSVKTNMGHSEAASGLCALTKVVLMFENELIYRGLHYEQPNSNIDSLREGKLKFVDATRELKSKIVPLSCYGFGGSNVHVIVRANEREALGDGGIAASSGEPRVVVMFGRSEASLNSFFDKLLETSSRHTRNALSDDFLALVDALSAGKIDRLMNYRGYLVVNRRASEGSMELARGIRECNLARAAGNQDALVDSGRHTHVQLCDEPKCNLILAGLGSQWPGMAAGLTNYRHFWSTIERLASVLSVFEDQIDLVKVLTDTEETCQSLSGAFVAITAYEIALINIVRELKLNNLGKIVGHSLGEVSCAYAAQLFDEREAILVAYHLGRTLDANRHLIEGKMVVLEAEERQASELIESLGYQSVRVCCVNGPQSVTVSGSTAEMEDFCAKLKLRGDIGLVFIKELDVGVALHNETIMTTEIAQKLVSALSNVLLPGTSYSRQRAGAWISSMDRSSDLPEANAEYFAQSLCRKVNFASSIGQLECDSIVLELSPSGLFESILADLKVPGSNSYKFKYVPAMRAATKSEDQELCLSKFVGEMYLSGASFSKLTEFHTGRATEFPVRRQTPSLSSIFKWKHEHKMFVPRYPEQFSKSSAKIEMPIDIIQDRDKYMTGHCIEGRILFPATGYLYLIWRVFSFTQRKIYDACFQDVENELVPVEFTNVRLLRAVILGTRTSQIYIHLEEGTGRFEVKEGGSVVAEGYVSSPKENPSGLLYEQVREKIRGENLELTLSSDDIYKQFRVSGYDYGETFRNVEVSSSDGRYCRVRYNGHFIAFTDSILQSIFLAVSQYAPSGGLFLPTRFEYARFQPEVILSKLRDAKMVFDLSDGSLNTKAKREIMTKIMQRESGAQTLEQAADVAAAEANNGELPDEPKPECIFETYCDPITGIIITDGIEMRGIKASPAPRRIDNNEVMLESYQFVRDLEVPVRDENLTRFEEVNGRYTEMCNAMSLRLLRRLLGRQFNGLKLDESAGSSVKDEELERYLDRHLKSMYKPVPLLPPEEGEQEVYDIKKNGDRTLMSVLDQLTQVDNFGQVRDLVQKNRLHLMHDLIQSSFTSERFVRPLLETIIENSCMKRMKLRVMEINVDDGLMKNSLQHLIQAIEPSMTLDLSLAHPDIERLNTNKLLSGAQVKTFPLKDLASLFSDRQLRNLDLVVYKDISCYSLPKQVVEQNGLAPVLSSLNEAVRVGGFVMMVMRHKLTLAERILLSLSEPELIGLDKRHLDQLARAAGTASSSAADKINHINAVLAARCKLMLSEAERNRMLCIARKSDDNGCTILLFKSTSRHELGAKQSAANENSASEAAVQVAAERRVLLRVSHQDTEHIRDWLQRLKNLFRREEESPASGEGEASQSEQQVDSQKPEAVAQEPEIVWLCAVATKENPISGLVGMMQALRKELGPARLRCYYDCHTFRHRQEPVQVEEIERCDKFRQALARNLIWNCVDSEGNFGAYRHFTINSQLSYDDCLCSEAELDSAAGSKQQMQSAYVNCATRGDLSSFTWFETPYKYLSRSERSDLVRVAYSALNFRDIMLASGRLPLDAIPIRAAMSDCLLGLEYSGFRADGRRVMGMVMGKGIATHVITASQDGITAEVPDWMDMREAATIPVVYTTAIMALIYRGRMQRGESVLIHAGSGGVGQAAIRLAAHHGLEIYTTVGSDAKRQFLLQEFPDCLDDTRIFSSRDCTFEERIMERTCGRGVDLVLNSLADDKLQASIRCLADGGRFLEIGKYDMSTDTKLEMLRLDTNKSIHGILLDKTFDQDDMSVAFKTQLRCIMQTLRDGLAEGYIKPIKYTTFKRHQIEEAFRFMATGKHIGKVLIDMDQPLEPASSSPAGFPIRCVPTFQVSGNKSYIVTGGLGGFGLEITKWLVRRGARYVLLTSRTGLKTGYQKATLQRLTTNDGVKFLIVDQTMADTTTEEGVRRLLQLALELSPERSIGVIFHLAMVLKDSLLENMQAEDFEMVLKPKIDTCLHLDRVSREMRLDLDHFVAFSSVTSGKGNAGQANYAYANSCLERICEARRSDGLNSLAIQWGAIGDVGVAFENLGGNDVVVGGTVPQRLPSCLATLSRLLCAPYSTCLSVVPVNRSSDGAGEKGDLVGAIMHVLGIKDPSKVSDQATLGELGLDSLMAVEIRQYIEREYDMTLNIQEIRNLTIEKIREINDKERTGGKAAVAGADSEERAAAVEANTPKVKEVQGYGSLQGEGAPEKQHPAVQSKLTNGLSAPPEVPAIDGIFQKSTVASFIPQLELPQEDFCKLNLEKRQRKPPASNGVSNKAIKKRPIFFLPPVHGSFERLEAVCTHIERPCIGLNWTRRLNRAQSVDEVVGMYLDLLTRANWRREFQSAPSEGEVTSREESDKERVVDLVGYSFGATIAFELMIALHKSPNLKPGRLILLDGSPRQIELGSNYISSLTRKKPLRRGDKMDEMLMVYIIAHSRGKDVDYLELQGELAKLDMEDKAKFASERLVRILGLNKRSRMNQLGATASFKEMVEQKQALISDAMEAFCRRYDVISKYKAQRMLPGDCTLIRAENVYLTNQEKKFEEDLDLGVVVDGRVDLFVMKGDHESFLSGNQSEIASIITERCNR